MYITIVPTYGRDYKNKSDLMKDFNNNRDFKVCDMFSQWNNKSVNKNDLKGHYKSVKIRYNKLQKIIIVKL
tara:strand:- start:22 stop:234 length:213 start_codon:yes stop_codon:yes gene_type:complete